MLLLGLKQVIHGEKGTARFLRHEFPLALLKQVIGKTSTGESLERMSLDGKSGRLMMNHVGFGAISYEGSDFFKPELVVVVYLRHGDFGKDVAPYALKIIQKWREIRDKHHAVSCHSEA
jgi:cell division protein FtsI/penicillin-binding protein 2